MSAFVGVAVDDPAGRVARLEGGRNFRDLGGYPTIDGRRVRRGVLFRSGDMAALTRADWDVLTARGPVQFCDLRTTVERDRRPFPWLEQAGEAYWTRDCASCFGEIHSLLRQPHASAEAARTAMRAGYRRLPFEQAPAYREIFRRLRDGALPLVFNCSAGKDRTGVGAALILRALGVSDALIEDDYLLSRERPAIDATARTGEQDQGVLGRQPPDVVDAILSCDRTYLEEAMQAIDGGCGTFDAYLADVLGVRVEDRARLADMLLE